jgi:uncharacterized protein (DUF1800 family)
MPNLSHPPTYTSRRDFLRFSAAAVAAVTLGTHAVNTVKAYAASPSLPMMNDPELHFLNRISYGVRPEDLQRVRQIGIAAYLAEQLHPDTLDDSAMDDILKRHPLLFMDRKAIHSTGFDGRAQSALMEGMIWRAAYSKRQLYERMVEFWTDHFNIPSEELAHDLILMHREVIRKHALGKFRDLAIGVAQSPAMLNYLDQAYSSKEHPNENYARELLELHTLGVDGGHYTETDVKEAARALTGWTIHNGTDSGFYFDMEMHDTEEKIILGHTFPAGRGIEDGLHLLSLTINHPATAYFVCRKLCVRFVSDHPADSLVESAAQVWIQTDGAIIPVLRHIFLSPEFQASAGQKLRRPLDFFIGALRATGTTFRSKWIIWELVQDLAQPPYGWNPPNGYPDVAGAWISSSGLLARWNTAMRLTHEAYSVPDSGMMTEIRQRIGSPQTVGELVDAVAVQIFGVPLASAERAPFIQFVTDDGAAGDENAPVTALMLASKLGTLYGLMLASPIYQWR